MNDLLETVNLLINKQIGDLARLEHIKRTLEQNKTLFTSDREYVDSLVKHHFNQKFDTDQKKTDDKQIITDEQKIETKPISGNYYATNSFQYRGSNNYKSEGTTLVLSLLFGLLGFFGIGHRYVGDITKSLVLIYSGWALFVLNAFSLSPIWIGLIGSINPSLRLSSLYYGLPLVDLLRNAEVDYEIATLIATILMIVGPIGYYFLLIWQIFNARTICRKFNQFMDNTDKQLYEMTIIRKVIWMVIFLAPLILFIISFTYTLFPQ